MPEKNSKVRKVAISALLTAALALTGCASLPANAPTESVDYRACLAQSENPTQSNLSELIDYSVKQSVVTYGVQRTVAKVKAGSLAKSVAKLSKLGCDLVIMVGSDLGDEVAGVVLKNSGINFVYVTDTLPRKLERANIENLVTYGVDLFEAGLISGYLASGFSTNHSITGLCLSNLDSNFLDGVRLGALRFAEQGGETTSVAARVATMVTGESSLPDVVLTAGCSESQLLPLAQTEELLVGYGLDHYLNENFDAFKARFAVTVVPQVGNRLLEVIASDLEDDFIGGSLGSFNATYGNGGLALSPERDIPISTQTISDLETVTSDYEASLK